MTDIRVAQVGDADAVAELQLRAWQKSYSELVPAEALNQVNTTATATRWRDSMLNPPSPSHRLLIAERDGSMLGFTAIGPARDEDEPRDVGEVYILLLDPDTEPTTGGDLLDAARQHLREDGFTTAVAWLLEADEAMGSLFTGAGWRWDDARRELDMGRPVPEVRLRATL